MIFETHAHYDDEAFAQDREILLEGMREHGIETVINVCAEADRIGDTVALMERYPFVYGAVGVHPDDAGKMDEEILKRIQSLCRHEKTVAVGEIGLDYYWDKENHQVQKEWFERQMEVAREEKLPFIIHSRDAANDTLQMMKALHAKEMSGGVIHCFSYGKELAREYLNMGLYIGIGGVVTFKNARKLKEVAAYAPLEQILLETDSPYLAPAPNRGKRNSSWNLPYIAQEIAEIKGISAEEVEAVTRDNARKLFYKVK
ncbi:MAG: TatD family hydrolase [Blautia sp.]|jgi:TatD DNase family protein